MPKSILSSVNIFYFRLHFSCSSSDCDSTSLPADPSGDPSDQVVPGGGQVISSKHSILTIDDLDDICPSDICYLPFKLSFMYGTVICKFYDCYGRHLSDDASVKLVKCITVLEFNIYV